MRRLPKRRRRVRSHRTGGRLPDILLPAEPRAPSARRRLGESEGHASRWDGAVLVRVGGGAGAVRGGGGGGDVTHRDGGRGGL